MQKYLEEYQCPETTNCGTYLCNPNYDKSHEYSTPHPKKSPVPLKKPESGGPLKGPKTLIAEKGAPKYTTWKTTPLKPGELKEMGKGLQTYHWCPNHAPAGMWVAHKPTECKGHHTDAKPSERKPAIRGTEQTTVKFDLKCNGNMKEALTAFNKTVSWSKLCSSNKESDF